MSAARGRIRGRTMALLLAAAGCGMLLRPLQGRIDALNGARQAVDPDLVYFNSPNVVKSLSLGYDSLLADVYWMRAIQYYGRREAAELRAVRYKNLPLLLDVTTTLDPMLIDAYRAGSSFLCEPEPIGAGQPQAALKLLDKGIAAHPGDWRLYFDKGFVYYWFLKDARAAGETWILASRQPGAPAWMPSLGALALSRGGDVETARVLWREQYRTSDRADVRENARNHLDSIQVNEDLWALEFFIGRYQKMLGKAPADLGALVRAGLIARVPVDPSGVPYSYDPDTATAQLSSRSRVRYLAVPYDYRDQFMARLK